MKIQDLFLYFYPPFSKTKRVFGIFEIITKLIARTNLAIAILKFALGNKLASYLLPLPSINALISVNEAISLYKAAIYQDIEGDVVEIGTWRGGSALVLGMGLKNSNSKYHVYTVDPFSSERDKISKKFLEADLKILGINNPKYNYAYVKKLIKDFKLESWITVINKSSKEAVASGKQNIKLLFIDGDHRYETVKYDFLKWSKLVVPGGFVAFHDVLFSKTHGIYFPGPAKVVERYLTHSKEWRFSGQVGSLIYFQKV